MTKTLELVKKIFNRLEVDKTLVLTNYEFDQLKEIAAKDEEGDLLSIPKEVEELDMTAAKQIDQLAAWFLKHYADDIKEGSAVENVIRLFSPETEGNPISVPAYAVNTVAKRELKRLADYMISVYPPQMLVEQGGIVPVVINILQKVEQSMNKLAKDN